MHTAAAAISISPDGSGRRESWRRKRFAIAGVRILNLGGGIGVPEGAGQAPVDLRALEAALAGVKAAHPALDLWMEPGRYLVAEAGVLLARVTQTKGKGDKRYVGVATGMNSLIRPALYGARHEIVNLTRIDEPAIQSCTVVGPICESGDELGARPCACRAARRATCCSSPMPARTGTPCLRTTTSGHRRPNS